MKERESEGKMVLKMMNFEIYFLSFLKIGSVMDSILNGNSRYQNFENSAH
jgi:hypothetical protein